MRYVLLLTLVLTAWFAYKQADIYAMAKPATATPQSAAAENSLLGLPPLPIPENNPQTPAIIALGDKLFHDKRFSVDGAVSCANRHNEKLAFTDGLQVSIGHHDAQRSYSAQRRIQPIAILGWA
jgi:cytochrome c peroxidase